MVSYHEGVSVMSVIRPEGEPRHQAVRLYSRFLLKKVIF